MTIISFDDQDQPRVEAAGFWIRAAARIIDWFVMFAITTASSTFVAVTGAILVRVLHGPHEAYMELVRHPSWVRRVASVCATIAYHSVCEGTGGATIGKRLLGLQVVADDFGKATLMQGIRRTFGFFVDALFFGAVGASNMNDSPMKQRIGDKWGRTFVVHRETLPPQKQEPRKMLAASVIAAGAAAFHTYAIVNGTEVLVRMLTT